jgi:hypothetical protein
LSTLLPLSPLLLLLHNELVPPPAALLLLQSPWHAALLQVQTRQQLYAPVLSLLLLLLWLWCYHMLGRPVQTCLCVLSWACHILACHPSLHSSAARRCSWLV